MARFLQLALLIGAVCWAVTAQYIPEVPEQFEAISEGEQQPKDAEKADREFDDSLLSREGRPNTVPNQEKTKALYEDPKTRVVEETSRPEDSRMGKTELVDVNLYVKYYLYSDWYQVYYRCCPRRQNYGCRSNKRPLPCHSHYVNGVREWCCPFWPSFPRLYAANCNCNECAVFTSSCIRKGTCQRRYSWRSYYAVCYRNNAWGFLRRMTRLLPTSCYCRAR